LPIIRLVAAGNLKVSSGFLVNVIGSEKGNLKRYRLNKKASGGISQNQELKKAGTATYRCL
jgi:hypothetical protein